MVLTFDTILSQAVRSIDLLHGTTSSALRKRGLRYAPLPENTLGYAAQLIDTKNQAVLQTCILTKRGSPNRFAMSFFVV
jgi:hypothetical protein